MAKGKKKIKFISINQFEKISSNEQEKSKVKNIEQNSSESTNITETKVTESNIKNEKKKVIKDEKEDFSICIICTENVLLYAVGKCDHPICYKCSLRLRLFYGTKECPYCKTELDNIIFTKNGKSHYEDYNLSDFIYTNNEKKFLYETEEIKKIVESLEKYHCPDVNCSYIGGNWLSLMNHTKEVHNKFLCDICINKKKVFPYEQKLYTKEELFKHNDKGDFDNKSFKGHPQCGFCLKRFYDNDDLIDHCKKNYEECKICKQLNKPNQYFVNYNTLSKHFNEEHYVCSHPECLKKKYIAFASDIDLMAHNAEVHCDNSSGKGKHRFKPIDIKFNYVSAHDLSLNYFNRNEIDESYNNNNSSRIDIRNGYYIKKRNERIERNYRNDINHKFGNEDEYQEERTEEVDFKTKISELSPSVSPTYDNNNNNNNNISTSIIFKNAQKYKNSIEHKINKYKNDFPSLSGSSTSDAVFLSYHNNSPYNRVKQQKGKFKSMTQKLKREDEFPSLQSIHIRKQNN